MGDPGSWTLVILGSFLLAGYVAYVTGARFPVPRVTILLVLGVLIGPSVLDLVPGKVAEWFPLFAHMALAMVGFLLGERFVGKGIRGRGRTILWVTLGETTLAAAFVFGGTYAVTGSLTMALLLAGMAPASAPAAIFETVREGKAEGPLTDTALGVVAIDDAYGVVLFSLLFVAAESVHGVGGDGSYGMELLRGLWEIGGAAALGAAIAFPMAWITGKVRGGEPTLIEAAGFVFLCAGLATVLHVSYLLAAMTLGGVLALRKGAEARPFHAIEGVSEPFLAVFFLLSGIHLDLQALLSLGLLGGVYVLSRSAGKVVGGYAGGSLGRVPDVVRRRIGWCILPQAGVALGFALLARQRMPELGDKVLTLVIATTVLFEISGPLIARWQLARAGELGKAAGAADGD
jgi:Kef-type K+ transport system membrane component KefB